VGVDGGGELPQSWIPENRLGRVDWFVTDHLGSTKLMIDQNGTHRFTGDDDSFGINLRSFGDKDSHRYTGQILDEEQGVYYYGARYYLPEIGRFLSGDPVKQFHNIYNYAGNVPTALVDPDGKNGVNQLRNSNRTITIDIPVVWASRSISMEEARNALQSNYNNSSNGWEYERSKAGLFAGKIKYAVNVNVNVDMVDESNKKEVARLVSTYGASNVNYISTAANYNEMKGMKFGYGFAFDGKLQDSEANQYHNRAVVSLFAGSPDVLNVLCHEVCHLLGFQDINNSTAIGNKEALKFRINWNEPGSKDRRVTQDDINIFLDKTLPTGIDKMGDTSIPFSFPSNR
jgi:RHS repeat-associated protein